MNSERLPFVYFVTVYFEIMGFATQLAKSSRKVLLNILIQNATDGVGSS
jgi:hypothetical protein